MPDYNNGKIYKIECFETGEVYIGSTCEPTLARRLTKHVDSYGSWKGGKSNKVMSFDIIDRGEYKIMLIENFICNSRDQLRAREGHHIKEYKQDNKDNLNIQNKLYKMNHKEETAIYQIKYRIDNAEAIKVQSSTPFKCECGKRFTHNHRARHFKTPNHL